MLRWLLLVSSAGWLLGACSHTAPPAVGRVPPAIAEGLPDWYGTWRLEAARSTAIDPWRDLSIVLEQAGDAIILKRQWRGTREGGVFTDSVRVVPGGAPTSVKLAQWPDNRHLGAYISGDSTKTTTARWADGGRTLVTESVLTVSVQQGERRLRIYTEYRLAPDGDRLDMLELRSTRPRPLHYVFTRATR